MLLALACIESVLAAQIGDLSIRERYDLLDSAQRSRHGLNDAAFGNAIALRYTQLFSSLHHAFTSERFDPDDTELLFRAANIAEFYSQQADFIRDMSADLKRLDKFGKATNADYADLYRALVDVRDFERARSFAAAHPSSSLVALPVIEDAPNLQAGAQTVLSVEAGNHKLIHHSVAIPALAYIFVAGSPGCHFTRNAVRDLEANPAMKEVFAHHAQWVAPQDGYVAKDFDRFERWNGEHPDFQMSMAYKASEWPLVDSWATPTFYFVKDGKVAAKVVGWPDEGNIPALTDAARKIGLMK
ncbi:MAG: hypothetical protein JSS28_11610 [Proteobacteria bacterium]|nr:hypothetical protein [Pseudomonadota bacterium]